MPGPPSAADRPLRPWEWAGLLVLAAAFALFGRITLDRSTHPEGRMTDFGVYARAAWAVRAGLDPYDTPDDRGWHYLYPPPFVLLMVPFADPPAGADRAGCLPFEASVVIWYSLSLAAAAAAAHLFALAAMPELRPFTRRWWYLRLIPFDAALLALGYTLGRGQVNALVLLLLAPGFLASVRRRPVRAGLWLAAAAVVKVLPGLLILWPLLRREWRTVAGWACGGVLLMLVVPSLAWGVGGAVRLNQKFVSRVAGPVVTNAGDDTIGKEFSGTTSTDSQAFHAVVHALRHPVRETRPEVSDGLSKAIHYGLGLLLLGVTVGVGWRRRASLGDPVGGLLFVGALGVLMVHVAPASHMHYYAYSFPLLLALAAENLRRHPGRAVPTPWACVGLFGWTLLTGVPLIDTEPLCNQLRDYGLAVFANVGLWAWGVARLAAMPPVPVSSPLAEAEPAA